MADGSSYELDLLVKSVGAETSADQLNQLASSLNAANAVSTSFDSALARTKALLADASAASANAAAAVETASSSYNELERASTKAAKAVESANLKGKDTTALQAAADAAAAACRAQGVALDELKAKAASAASAESALTNTMKTLEAESKSEAAAMKAAEKAEESVGRGGKTAAGGLKALSQELKGADLPMGGFMRHISMVTKGLGSSGWVGAAVLATAAVFALSAAVVIGIGKLAMMAVELNKVAMAKIDKIGEKAKANFAALFAGVHVEKFVAALESVSHLLDANSATAKALKAMLSGLLNPLFDAAPKLVPVVSQLFRGMVLGCLEVAIWAVKAGIAIRGIIPPSVIAAIKLSASHIDYLKVGMYGMIAVIAVFAVAMVAAFAIAAAVTLFFVACAAIAAVVFGVILVAALLTVVIVLAAVAAGLLMVAAVVLLPVIVIGLLVYAIYRGIAALMSLGAAGANAASSMISGLVNGIASGAGAVWNAIKSMASGAVNALMSALQAHSPSKLFDVIGHVGIAGGVKQGVERGTPEVNAAVAHMVEPPDMPQKNGAKAGSTSNVNKGGHTFQITINAAGGDSEGIAAAVEKVINRLLEGDAMQAGAPA